MRYVLAAVAVLATAGLLAGPASSQDRGGKKPAATGDCDLKSLEKVKWCPKCDKVLEAADLDKDGKHKGDCGEKAKEIEQCVKKCYSASCHPNKELKAGGS